MSQHIKDSSRRISVLAIAGSDSGGGAGIQADSRTIAAHGLHPLTAITALTAQNTLGVTAVQACSRDVLRAQIDSAFADFDIRAIKIGMLMNADIVHCVADALADHPKRPLVLDPVMIATSGASLLEPEAVKAIVSRLFPLASVVTPNLPEARFLGAEAITDEAGLGHAATFVRSLGAAAVLLKGGHLEGKEAIDLLDFEERRRVFRHPRIAIEGHGTGCTLASAIACGLAAGKDVGSATAAACDYVHGALRFAYRPGSGAISVLDHDWQRWAGG